MTLLGAYWQNSSRPEGLREFLALGKTRLPGSILVQEKSCAVFTDLSPSHLSEILSWRADGTAILSAPAFQDRLFVTDANDAHALTLFSDDLSLLASLPGVSRRTSPEALADFLSLGYIPAPRTIYQDIQKIPSGHQFLCGIMRRIPLPGDLPELPTRFEDAVDFFRSRLKDLLGEILERNPQLDVMLSGGIDSGTLLGLLQEFYPDDSRQAITAVFREEDYNEGTLTALTAQKNHIRLKTCLVTPDSLELLDELTRTAGEPFADSSLLASATAFRHAPRHALLTGDGADEAFGGYRRYQAMLFRHQVPHCLEWLTRPAAGIAHALLPNPRENRTTLATLTRILNAFAQTPLEAYASFQQLCSKELRDELLSSPVSHHYLDDWRKKMKTEKWSSLPVPLRYNLLDLEYYLPDDGCTKQFLASTGTSAAIQAPFLDRRLVAEALRLPADFRQTADETKRILRAIGGKHLPPEVLRQPKRGFGVPLAEWFRGPLVSQLQELARSISEWDTHKFLNPETVRLLVDTHIQGKANHASLLYAILCLKSWETQCFQP